MFICFSFNLLIALLHYYLFSVARNRFNLRTTTAAAPPSSVSDEKDPDENAIDTSPLPSSTQRSLRPRLNLRNRTRPTASTTAAPASDSENSDSAENANANTEPKSDESEEKPIIPAAIKPASRFNLRRPNQLLAGRGRLSPLAKTTTASTEASVEAVANDAEKNVPAPENNKESAASDDSEQSGSETSTQAQTGLNRLRNRPRIQIQPRASSSSKPPTAASYSANRKVNPLISRRKIGASSTTTGLLNKNTKNT